MPAAATDDTAQIQRKLSMLAWPIIRDLIYVNVSQNAE